MFSSCRFRFAWESKRKINISFHLNCATRRFLNSSNVIFSRTAVNSSFSFFRSSCVSAGLQYNNINSQILCECINGWCWGKLYSSIVTRNAATAEIPSHSVYSVADAFLQLTRNLFRSTLCAVFLCNSFVRLHSSIVTVLLVDSLFFSFFILFSWNAK